MENNGSFVKKKKNTLYQERCVGWSTESPGQSNAQLLRYMGIDLLVFSDKTVSVPDNMKN